MGAQEKIYDSLFKVNQNVKQQLKQTTATNNSNERNHPRAQERLLWDIEKKHFLEDIKLLENEVSKKINEKKIERLEKIIEDNQNENISNVKEMEELKTSLENSSEEIDILRKELEKQKELEKRIEELEEERNNYMNN